MAKIYHNVCPLDCHASCRLLTEVCNGRIVKIKGDEQDLYTQGRICAKGYAHLEQIYSPDRVLYPLKQHRKGSGNWERVSWEEALTEITEKLIAIQQTYGNLLPVCFDKYLGTIGILGHCVEEFFDSMGRITAMSGSPCESAGKDAMMLNYGTDKKPTPEDMLNSKLIIIWGANPAWTTPHQMRYIFEAQEKGAKVVVIDPILTATAARSDLYYQVRPGTDGMLALGLAKVLLEEDLLDLDFLTHYTFGWHDYQNYLKTVNLSEVSAVTGIPKEDIYVLARLYGTTKPATIWLGLTLQRATTGGQNIRAIDSLAALSGNIGRPGGNVHYLSAEAWESTWKARHFQPDSHHRLVGTGRFTDLAALDPPIELLWIAGRNPAAQDPNTTKVKHVLEKIPMVVVADRFLTATAQMADYFLPIASPFEYEDIVVSFWHYGAAMNEQAIAPLGESKSDFSVMSELASILQRLKPGLSHFPTDLTAEEWLEHEVKPQLYEVLGISHYRELRDHYIRIEIPTPWQDHHFPTPSGKYEFFSLRAQRLGITPLPVPDPLSSANASYPFRLLNIRNYTNLNSQFRHSKRLQHLEEKVLFLNPEVAKLKNIEEGDKVKVYNSLGELVLRASLSPSLPRDIVVTYMGRTDANSVELNTLIDLAETDLGHILTGNKGLSFANSFINLVRVG